MRIPTRALGSLIICLSWLTAAPTHAQFGLKPLTKQELAQFEVWKPPARKTSDVPRIDLRDELGPVGDQKNQSSCTGWAVAYARTQMEARQRKWKPDRAARLFSPAFIYNTINGGEDRGSKLTDAFRLLQQHGCATTATMPYDQRDFLVQPSREAYAEAAQYRIGKVKIVTTLDDIRSSLIDGHVVILGIATDPVFNGGEYTLFTAKERNLGLKSRMPNQRHASHAICAVGYDDQRRALLLMNSWGDDWCQDGCCWVSYDLMRAIGAGGDGFCLEAFVMLGAGEQVNPDRVQNPVVPDRPITIPVRPIVKPPLDDDDDDDDDGMPPGRILPDPDFPNGRPAMRPGTLPARRVPSGLPVRNPPR